MIRMREVAGCAAFFFLTVLVLPVPSHAAEIADPIVIELSGTPDTCAAEGLTPITNGCQLAIAGDYGNVRIENSGSNTAVVEFEYVDFQPPGGTPVAPFNKLRLRGATIVPTLDGPGELTVTDVDITIRYTFGARNTAENPFFGFGLGTGDIHGELFLSGSLNLGLGGAHTVTGTGNAELCALDGSFDPLCTEVTPGLVQYGQIEESSSSSSVFFPPKVNALLENLTAGDFRNSLHEGNVHINRLSIETTEVCRRGRCKTITKANKVTNLSLELFVAPLGSLPPGEVVGICDGTEDKGRIVAFSPPEEDKICIFVFPTDEDPDGEFELVEGAQAVFYYEGLFEVIQTLEAGVVD